MGCLKIYMIIERFIGTKFESYAGFVCKYPWWFILLPIALNLLLGIGLINLTSDNDVESVYTPRNSQASKDRASLLTLFGDFSASNFYVQSEIETAKYGDVIFQASHGQNILTVLFLEEIQAVYSQILSFTFSDSSGNYANFSSVCAIRDDNCVVDGSIIFTTWFKSHLQSNSIPFPGSGQNYLRDVFGDIIVSHGILTNASYVKLRFNLRHESSEKKQDANSWMDEFLNKINNIFTNETNLFFAHSRSLDEELNKNIGGDIVFFSLTFTLMIVYATSATANYKCLSDRQNLGRAGVFAAALAILGSFGIVAGCGLEFVSIVGTMPFLIIGIGVDDMFLLLSGLAETYETSENLKPVDRIKRTMRSSGVGITITSLTDLLAFLIGATSKFKGVQNFCVYTGVAVLFCYLNYITFFLGCMFKHEERVFIGRHCCTCQKIQAPTKKNDDSILKAMHRCLCTGSIPQTRNEVEGILEKYPPRLLSRFVLLKPVKILVLICFLAYLGISIWGATGFQQGLVLKDLVAEDSYYYKYSQLNEDYYSSNFAVSINFPVSMVYSDTNTWSKIEKLQQDLQNIQGIHSSLSLNWLSNFKNSTFFDNTSEINFITALRSKYLPSSPQFINDIVFDSLNSTIVASRIYIFSDNVDGSYEQGKLMETLRKVVSKSSISGVIAYSPVFIFFEQYVAILPNTLQTLGVAIAAIFVVTALFLPHPVLVTLVTLTLAMILVGLFGFMHFWGLTLSSITMIHIIMSVGFSVDFSAHICHGYMDSGKSDRDAGVRGALLRSGGPIFNGAVSSIVGLVMLLFSKSFIFRSFFKVMLLIILLGVSHSLLFLPVVLSILGPKFSKREQILTVKLTKTSKIEVPADKTAQTYSNRAYDIEGRDTDASNEFNNGQHSRKTSSASGTNLH